MSHSKVLRGDCVEVLASLEPCSVDACVSDPPYGLGFMGKEWDGTVPGRDFAEALLRVLKPGAHAALFGGTRTFHRLAVALEDAGFEIRDCLSWLYGTGFPKSLDVAKAGAADWNGWGTALKPAWEPVLLVRKPLAGTVAQSVMAYGTGGLNVDACRIQGSKPDTVRGAGGANGRYRPLGAQGRVFDDGRGRWPANVVLDEEAAAMLDATGGASRFFYVAKPSRAERDLGCDALPIRSGGDATGREDGAPGTQSPRAGAGRTGGARNIHPTVKPIALMRWLCRLITPPGGLIIDPFCGSGTTLIAAHEEGFRCIGIERDPEYHAIASARVNEATRQLGLFGG